MAGAVHSRSRARNTGTNRGDRSRRRKPKNNDRQAITEEARGKSAQKGQKRKRRTSQPERRQSTREDGEEDEETDQRENEQYANHEPDELERLLGEFTDPYEITKAWDTPEHIEERNRYDENKEEDRMQKENHEPDTLERLLGEWMGSEEEPANKAKLKSQNIITQEEEKGQKRHKSLHTNPTTETGKTTTGRTL